MNTKEITIPTKWSEITLGQFRAYTLHKARSRNASPLEEKMVVVEMFCGMTTKDVRSLNLKDLNSIYSDVVKILEDNNAEIKFQQTFTFKGKDFGFVPNLSKLSTGEWVDYEELMKQGGYWQNAHKIMSILFRPIDKQKKELYSIEEYNDQHIKDNAEGFLDLPMDKVIGAQSFFFRLGTDLLMTLKTFTVEEKERRRKTKEKAKPYTTR